MTDDHCTTTYIHEERVQAALAHLVDSTTAIHLAETFKALSDPTRVRIVSLLAQDDLCVCEVAAALELIPAYLNILEGLGLIQSIERQQALKKIRPLVDQIPQIMDYYEGDPIAIETLLDAWAYHDFKGP